MSESKEKKGKILNFSQIEYHNLGTASQKALRTVLLIKGQSTCIHEILRQKAIH